MQIAVNNTILNYNFYENPNSEKYIIILPGWRRTSAEWEQTANQFKNKYNIIVLDFPGFGVSPKPQMDFDTYDYAKLVVDFLEKLNIKKCTVLGHSFGGRIAIILAATTNLVDQLVLIDSAGLKTLKPFGELRNAVIKLAKPCYLLLPKKTQYRLRKLIGSTDYLAAGEMQNILVKVVNQDLHYLLKDIRVPTLVIWGNKDEHVGIRHTKTLRKEITDARTRIVWGAGHSPHTEKPAKFIEILKEYL